jgi:organic radical activating enzyme
MLLSRTARGEPEVFATVQGEGPTAGVPCVFVRLAECNLRCGFCDTKYTWDWQQYDRARETIEEGERAVLARVTELAGSGIRSVVFTGGEPLLQEEELAPIAEQLAARGFRIEVETNGTVQPRSALAGAVAQWNVSPKLASSGNADRARLRPAVLAWFAAQPNATFKFVVASDADVDEVVALVARLELPPARVLLSPEGVETAVLVERSRWLAEPCTRHGYRLGTRLHVFLWGSERGR